MIRYEFDWAEVEAEIRDADPRWFTKAEQRTQKLLSLGRYEERSSIWSKVKPAFMRLQLNKCVFCERQFESPEYGTIEFDLEHFRPKGAVVAWPDPVRHPDVRYEFSTGVPGQVGYYWLAYEIRNYAACCKVCNTTFKLNFFPITGSRGASGATLEDLRAEEPLLCYPLGDGDEDPEELVTFVATTAVPAKDSESGRRRGRVIIDFFGLNSREQLHRERARMIGLFGGALEAEADGRATPVDRRVLDRLHHPALPHANCLRSFGRLWAADRATGRRALELCRAFAVGDAGTAPPEL